MPSILDQIVSYKKEELVSLKRKISLRDVQLKAADAPPALDFVEKFSKDSLSIIAEIKKASPSKGVIRENFRPLDLARICEDKGAAALSILTDEKFFRGSLDILSGIKKLVKIPCLRKDFTLFEYHVYEARGAGADAVLLITAILDDPQLKDFQSLASELGMMSLVEVHDEKELDRALKINPRMVGINNRDLKTFEVNVQTSLNLIQKIPQNCVKISESGLETHDGLIRLQESGFDGFLIGEALMREKDVGRKLGEFLGR